jgi:hypothetical protein
MQNQQIRFIVNGPLQEQEDLLQKALGDVLGFGDVLDVEGPVVAAKRELQHGAAGVLAFRRKPHWVLLQ